MSRLNSSSTQLNRLWSVNCVDLHPTEPLMLTAFSDGHVAITDLASNLVVRSIRVSFCAVNWVKFESLFCSYLLAASDDRWLRCFEYNNRADYVIALPTRERKLKCAALHISEPWVLVAGESSLINLWKWRPIHHERTYEGHTDRITQIAVNFRDNPSTFASASMDKTIRLWRWDSTTAVAVLAGYEAGISCIKYVFQPEQTYLISGSLDHHLRVWDVKQQVCLHNIKAHEGRMTSICVHPLLPLLWTGSEDSTVKVWNKNTFEVVNSLPTDSLGKVSSIACRGDMKIIAVGCENGSVIFTIS